MEERVVPFEMIATDCGPNDIVRAHGQVQMRIVRLAHSFLFLYTNY